MTSPPPAPELQHASALAIELRSIVRKLQRHLRERGEHRGLDLTLTQLAVLHRLEQSAPATVSALARSEGMRPQSMSAVIAPLEAAGLVQGDADPNDRRQTLFSLTPRCLQWLDQGRAARQDWLTRQLLTKLSLAEQQQLHAALGLLARLVED